MVRLLTCWHPQNAPVRWLCRRASSAEQVLLAATVPKAVNLAAVVRGASGRCRPGNLCGQPEVGEEAVDAVGILDEGADDELAVAVGTGRRLQPEGAGLEQAPGPVAAALALGRRGRGSLVHAGRRRWVVAGRSICLVWLGRLGHDASAPFAGRGKYTGGRRDELAARPPICLAGLQAVVGGAF